MVVRTTTVKHSGSGTELKKNDTDFVGVATYFEKLASQEPSFVIGGERHTNRVVRGEFPIAMNVPPRLCLKYAVKGVMLKMAYPKEGGAANPGVPLIMAQTKHPNAAKLFIDWLLSLPGQELFRKTTAYISGREGMSRIPKGVKPEVAYTFPPKIEDCNVIPISWKDVTSEDVKEARQEWISIFAK